MSELQQMRIKYLQKALTYAALKPLNTCIIYYWLATYLWFPWWLCAHTYNQRLQALLYKLLRDESVYLGFISADYNTFCVWYREAILNCI